jgi:hypothetical protein
MKAYAHLVRFALAAGYTVSVFDGEDWPLNHSTDHASIIQEIESVDEAEIHFHEIATMDYFAWARVSAYGLAADETVIDHTVCNFMDIWQEAYDRQTEGLNDSEQLLAAAQTLRKGEYGGFAAAIGDAATRADSTNLRRLAAAFPELFALETA